MALRHGFKSYANDLARLMRRELRLAPHEPLDPWRLAEHLAIPVIKLSDLGVREARHFLRIDASAFSAVTVFDGRRRVIVHNDAHDPGRQANDVAHEISHGLLMHEPGPAFGFHGCRNWNSAEEDEANWLGPALLISDEAAIHIVRTGMAFSQAATAYGVSQKLVTMRVNVTGAVVRVARSRRPTLSSGAPQQTPTPKWRPA